MLASSKPDLFVANGAALRLPAGPGAWRVESGRIEAYLLSPERRRLIALVGPDGHAFGLEAESGFSILIVATETARLIGDDNGDWRQSAESWLNAPAAATLAAIAQRTGELDARFALEEQSRDQALVGQIAAQHEANAPSLLVAAIKEAALALGGVEQVSGAPPSQAEWAQVPALARRFGLRASRVILPSGWRRDDHGPLLVRDAEGAPLFTASRRNGYDAPDAEYEPLAWRLYGPVAPGIATVRGMIADVAGGQAVEWRPLVMAATGAALLGLVTPAVTAWLFDAIVPAGERGLLVAAGVALLGTTVLTALLGAARALALGRAKGRGMIAMTAGVADRVLRLPARFFRTVPAGDFAQRLANLETIRALVGDIVLTAALAALFALVYLVQLVVFDWRLAAAGLALTLVYAAATLLNRFAQLRPLTQAAERSGTLARLTYELLEGVAKLRTNAAEERMLARWDAAYVAESEALARAGRIEARFSAFTGSWSILTLAGLFGTAALLAQAGTSPGRFIAFLTAFALFQAAFTQLCESALHLLNLQPKAALAQPIMTAEPEARRARADPGRLSGAVSVSGLSFAYDGAQRPIINGLSFDLSSGEHLAIVGESGSGKSTILRLMLGFETPLTGSIAYDGQDFASLDPARVRSQIGVVLQSSQLFAGSIQDNIRGASDADLESCIAAAEAAGLASDLKLFPMGLHTPITEGAGTLSGGQRQRILIARALAGRPRLLFLDEATSALDNDTQKLVMRTMDALNATRITIAHRLSTVRNADRIAVLERGRFVELGDFATLMAKDGAFARLAARQLLKE